MTNWFKNADTGQVYWYDDVQVEKNEVLPELTPMSDDEITAHLAPRPVDILAVIAARRFTAEVAGITVAEVPVYTDRTTQNKLTAAAFRALRNPEYTVDWKCTNGSFITLNAEQITAIADAVGDYVQACYTREGELVAAFNDGSYTEAMLEEGWPA